jgi:hypothetical protein
VVSVCLVRDEISREPQKQVIYTFEFKNNLGVEGSRTSGADGCVAPGSAIRNKYQELLCCKWAEKSGAGQIVANSRLNIHYQTRHHLRRLCSTTVRVPFTNELQVPRRDSAAAGIPSAHLHLGIYQFAIHDATKPQAEYPPLKIAKSRTLAFCL